MTGNPKRIVAEGYDRIAPRYLDAFAGYSRGVRREYLDKLLSLLQPNSLVLELGCGPGIPMTRALARDHQVIAADISSEQLVRAKENVSDATFIRADMGSLFFAPDSFDAVAAFYSIIHLPRDEHAELFRRIALWLKAGGVLLVTLGSGDDTGTVEDDWLGTPMFFSGFDAETNRRLVVDAGFTIIEAEIVSEQEHDGQWTSFLWVLARAG